MTETTGKQNQSIKLTNLDRSDKNFRGNLRIEIERRLSPLSHKQVLTFALRVSLRTAWSLQKLPVKDKTKLDRFYFYYLRANTAALTVYLILDSADGKAASAASAASSAASFASASAFSASAFAASAFASASASAVAVAFAAVAFAASAFAASAFASASASAVASAVASVVDINNFLIQLDKDIDALEANIDIMDLSLWQDKEILELKRPEAMNQLWLDYIFIPAYEGKLVSAEWHQFAQAFLSIEEEVFAVESADAMADTIRAYMDNNDLQEYREARLVLLGNGGAGKTSLVKLLNEQPLTAAEKPTPRISVSKLIIKDENEKDENKKYATLNIWDFGGQVIMHSTHSFFISNKSSYVIVCNQRANEQPDKWLDMIVARIGDKAAAKQTVFIVYSYCDNPDKGNNVSWRRDNTLLRAYGQQLDLQFFNIDMDPSKAKGEVSNGQRYKVLRQNIDKQALMEAKKNVPPFIVDIKQAAEDCENSGQPYISYKQLKEKVGQLDIKDGDFMKRLQIANNYGYIFPEQSFFDLGDKVDKDLILINQRHWLTYGVYELVNSTQAIKNHGILLPKDFEQALHPNKSKYILNTGEIVDKRPADKNTYDKVNYDEEGIALLRRIIVNYKWGFIYHRRFGEMLLPLATKIDEPEDLSNYFSHEIKDEHYMELVLENKPKDFFFRLATYLEPHLNTEQDLWRTGAIVHFYNSVDTKAVLEMPANTLKLTIFGKEKDNFLQLLLININETLKYYTNLKAQIFERMDISDKDKEDEPARYEMISSGMIEGLLSNNNLIQTIRKNLLHRSTNTMSNITNNYIYGSRNSVSTGDNNTVDNHAQVNEPAQSLLGALQQAKQAANIEQAVEIDTLCEELLAAIKEVNVDKKEGLFKRILGKIEKFNTVSQGVENLIEYMPAITSKLKILKNVAVSYFLWKI